MKQLLFLLLFPCFAMAQYQGNGNQKITLGEQTTADGLVYRGLAADTTRKPSVDTMAYILLDTNTNIIWQYKKAVNNAWTRVGGSISSGVTGVLPVANGGTNASTFTAGSVVFAGASGTSLTQDNSNFFWNNSNKRLGIGTNNPNYQLEIKSSSPIIGLTGEDEQPIYNALHYSNISTRSGRVSFYRSGGSVNAKTTVLNNYPIGQIVFTGFNGTDDSDAGARFIAYADADWSDGSTPSRLVFETTPSGSGNTVARMTIKSSGNVGIGTTTPQSGYKLHVIDSVYVGGRVSAAGYTTRSDYNLKDEIQTLNYGLNEVIQMQPVKYTYKSNGEQQLGFIAQDIGTLIPESVHFDEFMGVDYQSIIPILTKAIQEQNVLIKALEQRIINLENK